KDRGLSQEEAGGINRVTYEYDPALPILKVTDALVQTTIYEHSVFGLISKVTDPSGNQAQFFYDADSDLIKLIDENGHQNSMTYNNCNLITFTNDLGQVATFTYDSIFNQPTSFKDFGGRTTNFTLDPNNGNVIAIKYPDGSQEFSTYDNQGLMVS